MCLWVPRHTLLVINAASLPGGKQFYIYSIQRMVTYQDLGIYYSARAHQGNRPKRRHLDDKGLNHSVMESDNSPDLPVTQTT